MTALRRICATVAAGALALGLVSAGAAPASASASASDCTDATVERAPALSTDTRDGAPVALTPLADGSSVPVLMIHGFTGRARHDDSRAGAFSHDIDLTANKLGTAPVGRSLIGQLQDAGGTTVYTFDYHDASARWVTDDAIGGRLSDALTCLSASHGHPVIVVAHSMGGLATREALWRIGSSGTRSVGSVVSDVITYGTPNTGSWLASVLGGAKAAALGGGPAGVAVLSMLTACGTLTTASMRDGGLCQSVLGTQVATMYSQAGEALRVNSTQIRALASWPSEVTVHALAGSIDVEVTRSRWFGLERSGSVNVGDFVVGRDSAMPGTDQQRDITCNYTMSVRNATTDNVEDWFGLRATNDTRDHVVSAGGSACFHGSLMRSVELTNEALGIVVDRVSASALPSELRGTWCVEEDARRFLADSQEPCFSAAALRERWPDVSFGSAYDGGVWRAVPGMTSFTFCLQYDQGDGCTTASQMSIEFLPAGAEWDCAEAMADWGGCDPDYSDLHDASRDRLLIVPNHQQGEVFWDTVPMYRD